MILKKGESPLDILDTKFAERLFSELQSKLNSRKDGQPLEHLGIECLSDHDFRQYIDSVYAAQVVNSTCPKVWNFKNQMFNYNPNESLEYFGGEKDILESIMPDKMTVDKGSMGPPSLTDLSPNLFSRMYYWYPGFSQSGYSFHLRPGIHRISSWPRNRWVMNNGNYYLISNHPESIPVFNQV